MSDSVSSSNRPQRQLLISFLFILFFFSSAFKDGEKPSPTNRAENVAALHFREDITGYAQNFLGLHYHYAGTSTKTGFDCSGFTSFILKEFGVKVSSCSATQSTQGNKISLEDVLPGDLVFFGRRGHIQHVALVVKRTVEGIFVVHSTCSRGIIVENINTSKYWAPRILFARDVITEQANLACLF